jgi:hypothetical protein
MSKVRDGYRVATPDEREILNRLGTCWVVRVMEKIDVACPNRRVEGSDSCEHHERKNTLGTHHEPEPEPEPQVESGVANAE